MTYNGWSNYPTWAVKLWLDNDEGTYLHVQEMTEDSAQSPDQFRDAQGTLADKLKGFVEEFEPDLGASMHSDLLGWALEQVDWYEIADSLLDDMPEDEEDAA